MAVQYLRPKRGVVIATTAAASLFVAGFAFTYSQNGWTWVSLAFAGLTLIGIGAILEVATSRVVLHDDALHCGTLWSRRRYPVADIASVSWEKVAASSSSSRPAGSGSCPSSVTTHRG